MVIMPYTIARRRNTWGLLHLHTTHSDIGVWLSTGPCVSAKFANSQEALPYGHSRGGLEIGQVRLDI